MVATVQPPEVDRRGEVTVFVEALDELYLFEPSLNDAPDEELASVLARLDELRVQVRAEQVSRRRRKQDLRLLDKIGSRASCVFCRRVYSADLVANSARY